MRRAHQRNTTRGTQNLRARPSTREESALLARAEQGDEWAERRLRKPKWTQAQRRTQKRMRTKKRRGLPAELVPSF